MIGRGESLVFLVTLIILISLRKSPNIYRRYALILLGVVLFEYFVHPPWTNKNVQVSNSLFLGIRGVIALAWADIIIVSTAIVESSIARAPEWRKFFSALGLTTIAGLGLEALVVQWIVKNNPAVIQEYLTKTAMVGNVPEYLPLIELLYIGTVMALVLGFVRYWELALGDRQA